MKTKAHVDLHPHDEDETSFDDMTPNCHACDTEPVGVVTEVYLVVKGMLFPSSEYDVPVFIPDPDVRMTVLTMPNGQLGIVTDQSITKYMHAECLDQLVNEAGSTFWEDAEEEEEEEEEDDE